MLAGIVVTQAILYGPSLLGLKIMLPLDILAQPNVYIPRTAEIARIVPHDVAVSDLVHPYEIQRRFAHSEIFAGRLPLWQPFQYSGSPNIWPWFSPFMVVAWSTESPVIWAWVHLLEAIVTGVGAYLFFRRALGVDFWPATFAAWCYPMTGFFVFWQGNLTSGAAFWLPWILLAVDNVARKPSFIGVSGLAGSTLLVLISGNLDVAGQCLLAAGLFAAWRVIDSHRTRKAWAATRRTLAFLGLGWVLGFCLAAPYWLPVLDYSQTGARMVRRAAGQEERPPVGLAALPQTVVPDMNGSSRAGSVWLKAGNQIESSAAAYAGLVATLLVAPLAGCSRRHRSFTVAASAIILLSLAWSLDLPVLVSLLRLPVLNMMSHNRLVFVGSFFILGLAAIGLDALRAGTVSRRRWFWIPASMVVVLTGWCIYRTITPPEPIATQVGPALLEGKTYGWVRTPEDLAGLKAWFTRAYGFSALLGGIAVLGWSWLLRGKGGSGPLLTAVGVVMVGDMVWFAYGRSAQCDPALYFPRIPLLEELARAPAGRVLGYGCLPAPLAYANGLRDVRGYDGVDPARYIELLDLAAQPGAARPHYALTQWFQPRVNVELPGRLRLPPVLDLLGVRYLIFRGEPVGQITPQLRAFDYWAMVNPTALPRVFVPRRVECLPDPALRLQKLGASDFDPRAVAFFEQAVELPGPARGAASIVSETPTQISLKLQMETTGLVVLADRWDKGWAAYVDGRYTPVLRVNHALRGVVVPAAASSLQFRYEPSSLAWGIRLAVPALALLGTLAAWEYRRATRD